tara:strand:+ start:785 stop:1006 length:222 start_codon:yes stop_codon:yes gene_type:complete
MLSTFGLVLPKVENGVSAPPDEKPRLLYLGETWCQPCGRMKTLFKDEDGRIWQGRIIENSQKKINLDIDNGDN